MHSLHPDGYEFVIDKNIPRPVSGPVSPKSWLKNKTHLENDQWGSDEQYKWLIL
jgi:hypothetical protein